MKKIFCLILALLMLAGVFAGCGGSGSGSAMVDNDDEVTLVYAMPWSMQSDTNIVEDKINERLAEIFPNTKLDFMFDQAMADKWSLWMSGKTPIDIAHSGYATVLQSEVNKDSYMPLNELIDKYAPTIKEERDNLYHDLYLSGTVNNDLYAIPVVQYFINNNVELRYNEELDKYVDAAKLVEITHASPKTTEQLYEFLDDAFKKASEAGVAVSFDAVKSWNSKFCYRGYKVAGGSNSNYGYDATGDSYEIIDLHTTEEYKTYIKWMQKWYNEGYIAKDVLTNTSAPVNIGFYFGSNCDVDESYKGVTNNGYRVLIDNPELRVRASHDIGNTATYTSIPATSENPVRAIKFLDFIRSEDGAEIANMLAYGIEGTHYEKTGDNTIKAFDYQGQGSSSTPYGVPCWMIGNNFNMYIVEPYTATQYEYGKRFYEEINPSIRKHPLYGFGFSTDNISVEFSNIVSINIEYETQLAYGVMKDWEAGLKTLIERCEAANQKGIIEEFQKQANDYVAANK